MSKNPEKDLYKHKDTGEIKSMKLWGMEYTEYGEDIGGSGEDWGTMDKGLSCEDRNLRCSNLLSRMYGRFDYEFDTFQFWRIYRRRHIF